MDPRTEPEHPAEQLDAAEEVGPEGCDPKPTEVETQPVVADRNLPEDCEFDVRREIEEQYTPEREVMVAHPLDGLPVPSHELGGTKLPLDPTFSYDHVCVEDDREWVEVFCEEFTPDVAAPLPQIGREPNAVITRIRWKSGGVARERMKFPRARVQDRWGLTFVELSKEEFAAMDTNSIRPTVATEHAKPAWWETERYLLPVRPIRPKCVHFKRQLFNTDGMDPNEPGGKTRFDNCTHPARRSIGGASMSLRGQVVYACDYRSPLHHETVEEHLDTRDRERLTSVPELVPLFKMEPSSSG